MYRTTQDVVELRRWAEARGARPCREEVSGRLTLAVPGRAGCTEVGWEEFEPAFAAARSVVVYDDAPGCIESFIGTEDEARAYLCGGTEAPAQGAPPA